MGLVSQVFESGRGWSACPATFGDRPHNRYSTPQQQGQHAQPVVALTGGPLALPNNGSLVTPPSCRASLDTSPVNLLHHRFRADRLWALQEPVGWGSAGRRDQGGGKPVPVVPSAWQSYDAGRACFACVLVYVGASFGFRHIGEKHEANGW